MLNAVTTDINSVDESARKFYTEREGKFYLNVNPVDGLALEDVTGLKTALAAERRAHGDSEAQRREALARLDAYGDLDPVAARTALAAGSSPDIDSQVAARVEALRAGIAEAAGTEARATKAELETTRGTLAARNAQLDKLVKAAAISAELDRLGPLEEARDVLVMLAGQHVTMREIDGEMRPVVVDRAGQPKLDAKGEAVSIRAFMQGMRDERAVLFKPTSGVTGLGGSPADRSPARGGAMAGPNPYSRAGWNLTQQVLMQQRNPALAARLRAEAGA